MATMVVLLTVSGDGGGGSIPLCLGIVISSLLSQMNWLPFFRVLISSIWDKNSIFLQFLLRFSLEYVWSW
jgi:hypothetical protein